MRLRKVCVSVLALLLLISSLQLTAFAEEEKKQEAPNLSAMVSLYNDDCLEADKLKDAKISMTLTKDADPNVSVEIPLAYEETWMTFSTECYIDDPAMAVILADLTANQAVYGDILGLDELLKPDESKDISAKAMKQKLADAMAESAEEDFDIFGGYTVSVNGLPEGEHYKTEVAGLVMTGEMVVKSFDVSVKAMEELFAAFGEEMPATPTTYGEYYELNAQRLGYDSYEDMCKDFGYTDKEVQEELLVIQQQDEILAQAKAGTYAGALTLIGMLECDCPELAEYEIYHEYYKEVNGKRTLVARIGEGEPDEYGEYYLTGEVGDYIMAKDYVEREFDGKIYDYVGSWDSWTIYDDEVTWDEEEMVSEFKLGDFEYDGLCLRYVYVEEVAAPEGPTDVDQSGEDAPLTGDHTPIGVYVALFVTAILALAALLVYLKKKQK